jgi:general transcription factor 3C polypeptide 5 (transcription factor C subunit 1)
LTCNPSRRPTPSLTTMDKEQQVAAPSDEPQQAPWLPIPSRAISAVEHPCIVKNVDKGILSLGGPVKLSKVRHRSVRTKTGD